MTKPVLAVVIPCFKVKKHILKVLSEIPSYIDHIIVIDDKCPEKSGAFVAEKCKDPRVNIVYRKQNGGVGAAVKSGYMKALKLGGDILIKMDGDGQMAIADLPALIEPILDRRADYTKGNRFAFREDLREMPSLRLFGNSVLSFLSKFSSGYWRMMDPTNGYTAIHKRALEQINLEKIADTYFFESDMLCKLKSIHGVMEDVPMRARYGDEESNLKIQKIIGPFLRGHLSALMRRIVRDYYIRDFNLGSLGLLFGLPFFIFGLLFGLKVWVKSLWTGIPATSGTVMLSAIFILVGIQFLMLFFQTDMQNQPTIPIQNKRNSSDLLKSI